MENGGLLTIFHKNSIIIRFFPEIALLLMPMNQSLLVVVVIE